MIKAKDVIRMRIPYPGISDKLAVSSHMYICKADSPEYEYIKCQTLKPYMMTGKIFRHYVDEAADRLRNPFQRMTRIDCDKTFITTGVQYDDGLKTTVRPDVCQELYDDVIAELEADGYDRIVLNADELIRINTRITKG